MQTHVRIIESSQLEGSYVGDLLYPFMRILTHPGWPSRPKVGESLGYIDIMCIASFLELKLLVGTPFSISYVGVSQGPVESLAYEEAQ